MAIDINTDSGKFRAALLLSGFFPESEGFVFNDAGKTRRRLKLWNADAVAVFGHDDLVLMLKEIFGDRYIEHGFVDGPDWSGGKSFYVRLVL